MSHQWSWSTKTHRPTSGLPIKPDKGSKVRQSSDFWSPGLWIQVGGWCSHINCAIVDTETDTVDHGHPELGWQKGGWIEWKGWDRGACWTWHRCWRRSRHIASGLAQPKWHWHWHWHWHCSWLSLNDTDIGTAADIDTDTASDIGPVKLHIGGFSFKLIKEVLTFAFEYQSLHK